MNEYLPRQKPSERASKQAILNSSLLPFFGDRRLDEIDQSLVNAYIAAQTSATKTVNNRLAVLSTLMKYAGPRGCKLIPEPQLSCHIDSMEAEIIAVPMDDVRKLVQAATDDRYVVAVLLAAEAGLRIGEIRGLQWTDMRDGRITIRRSVDPRNNIGTPKHNKARTVRLSSALVTALAKLPRRGLWIVSRLDGGFLGYWAMLEAVRKLYERAGVTIPVSETGETMPWHSLRHTFGTECAARGVPLPTIKELMGHADIKTTMRYVTVTDTQKDAAIERAFGAGWPTAGQQMANNSSFYV
jgi:integrase